MGVFNRKAPRHYVPIHPDNVESKDWIVLLEVGTLVGRSIDMLRVAITTLERKIVTKYDVFLRKKYFLVVEGYDPRIHALFFCPRSARRRRGQEELQGRPGRAIFVDETGTSTKMVRIRGSMPQRKATDWQGALWPFEDHHAHRRIAR
jgi:hypothetical protein